MKAKQLVPKQINKNPINNSSKKTPHPPHSPNPKLITPTETHLVSLIHSSKNSQELQQLHTQVIKHNHSSNSWVVTQLISSYSLHKSVSYAVRIFSHFQNPNLFVFNALIRALTDHSCFERSVMYFVCMVRRNVRPDRLTYPFVLKSVGGLGEGGVGRMVHGEVVKRGCEFDSFVRVSLVDMYVRVELLECGLKVFEESPEGNKMGSVLLWNVLVNGCCKVGDLGKAVEIFEAMPVRNVGSWNCLINGLLRHGEVDRAGEFFCRMPERNVVSWTMMVSGFSHNGCFREALGMFSRMLIEGVRPNELSFVSALLACAKAGAIDTGVRIHCYAWRSGFQLDSAVGTALIEMYAKCGFIDSASRVFDMTKYKDIRTWTAIIWGSAIHGCFEQAIQCFQKMKLAGIKPDGIVFLAILTACSHAGQVEWGLHYFNCMKSEYSIKPTIKHYAVVVDLFGRAGQLDEAFSFVENMPLVPDLVIWGALFCACRAHKNIKMAEYTSHRLLELETQHPGNYVFLSNVYAGVGRWEDVERVRSSMKDTGLEKEPGWSYIEVGGQVHSFVAGDHSHDRAEELYMKLEEIASSAREQGYMPETEWILHNIEEEEKEESLGSHSEKLALAFALISTTPGTTIRIVKNLRVCGDCHSFMKYVSKMSWRQILLRDNKRFHHFRDGTCSCGDYW